MLGRKGHWQVKEAAASDGSEMAASGEDRGLTPPQVGSTTDEWEDGESKDPTSRSRCARGESGQELMRSGRSLGCEGAAEMIRGFTDRLRSFLRPKKGYANFSAGADRIGQSQRCQDEGVPGGTTPLPHIRCGTRNPVAASGCMAWEQPARAPRRASVHGGAAGEGAGDS